MSTENNPKKRKLDIITNVEDSKKDRAVPNSDRATTSFCINPKNNPALTMASFFRNNRQTPPKGSENIRIDDQLKLKSEELLGIPFDELDTEKQLRFTFIVMKEYPKYLEERFMAGNSPFLTLLKKDGLRTAKEAILASLETDTPCGIRLGRLIYLGGDVITEECNRDQLDPCILTYDEFVEQNPTWSDTTGMSIFKRDATSGRRVEPFINLQTDKSDLCYLIQTSNAINYCLQRKALEGDEQVDNVRLNKARRIRNVYSAEQSCKHVYVGRGAIVEDTLIDILSQGNPRERQTRLLRLVTIEEYTGQRAAEDLYRSLCHRLRIDGPAVFDIKSFKEFEAKGATTHAGLFSTKTVKGENHSLLLVDIRQSNNKDTSDGGGYYALFQNTWKNRPIWVELGFGLLLSMTGTFLFINNSLPFDGKIEAADLRENVLAMSSSPAPMAIFRYANDDPAQESKEDGPLDVENAVIGAAGVERPRDRSRFTFPEHLENFQKVAYKPNTFYIEE